jgi:hypothetical protein
MLATIFVITLKTVLATVKITNKSLTSYKLTTNFFIANKNKRFFCLKGMYHRKSLKS